MKKYVVAMLGIMLLIIAHEQAHAGAWTQKRGHGFYKLEGRFIHARRYFEPDGRITGIPTLKDFTMSFYGEYGFSARFTLVAYAPFYKHLTFNRLSMPNMIICPPSNDSVSGFADSDVGFRFGFKQSGATVMSGRFMLGLPVGENEQQNGLLTGDGEFNQLLAFELGHSFYPLPLYFSGEAGFNNRTKGFSDEFRYAAELGYTFWNAVTLMMKFTGVASLKNGEDNIRSGVGGLYGNNAGYLALGPALFYQFHKSFGLTAGVDGATYGQNVPAAPSYSLGIYFKQ